MQRLEVDWLEPWSLRQNQPEEVQLTKNLNLNSNVKFGSKFVTEPSKSCAVTDFCLKVLSKCGCQLNADAKDAPMKWNKRWTD